MSRPISPRSFEFVREFEAAISNLPDESSLAFLRARLGVFVIHGPLPLIQKLAEVALEFRKGELKQESTSN
jgi:hypothetical protein